MLWLLKVLYYRFYQLVMKTLSRILPFPVPKIVAHPGCIQKCAYVIEQDKIKKVFIVTDKYLVKLKLHADLISAFKETNISYVIFDDVSPNPTIQNVEDGLNLFLSSQCKAIVALGGGSVLDCAKIIGARVVKRKKSVQQLQGLFKIIFPIPTLYAIPTTAGSGSETTIAAVITDKVTKKKLVITDFCLVPRYAFLDAMLMVNLPNHITAATGMDALTHAIEAYIGRNGNNFTDTHAEKSVELIFDNLEKVYFNPTDITARHNMALAAYYAGAAFTRTYVGYVHAIAHNLGGIYGVPHGLANAIILPYILDFFVEVSALKLAKLAKIAQVEKSQSHEGSIDLAHKFIAKIRAMNLKMNIPTFVKELQRSDVDLIVQRALKEAHPSYPVPKIMNTHECTEIVLKLLAR